MCNSKFQFNHHITIHQPFLKMVLKVLAHSGLSAIFPFNADGFLI